jgi:phage/plasmid-associated DNA primase
VLAAVAEYRSDEDTLGMFIDEKTEEFAFSSVPHSTLYTAYKKWAEESGTRHPLTSKNLASRLRDRAWKDDRGAGNAKIWKGVQLRSY